MKYFMFLLCLFMVGCDLYIDPKQVDAAYELCKGKNNTKAIQLKGGNTGPSSVNKVYCVDGARYITSIAPEAKRTKVLK